MASGRENAALSELEAVVAIDRRNVRASEQLAALYRSRARTSDAIRLYEQVLTIDSTRRTVRSALADAYKEMAVDSFRTQAYDAALRIFDHALAADSAADVYGWLTYIMNIQKRDSAAIALLPIASRWRQDNGSVHNNVGFAYFRRKMYPEALASYREAFRRDSTSIAILRNYVSSLRRIRQFESAFAVLDAGLRMYPNNYRLLIERADILVDALRPREALKVSDEALRLFPDSAGAHRGRGRALFRLGQYAEALAEDERAGQLNPADATTHNNRAADLIELGRLAEAVSAANRSISATRSRFRWKASPWNRG